MSNPGWILPVHINGFLESSEDIGAVAFTSLGFSSAQEIHNLGSIWRKN